MSNLVNIQNLSEILKFATFELTTPVRKHVFNFVSSDIRTKRHHLLAASSFAIDTPKLTSKSYVLPYNYESLLLCDDDDFLRIFRLSRKTVQLLKAFLVKENLTASADISVDKKILLFLWILGTTQPLKEASIVFSLPEKTVVVIFNDMCTKLSSYKSKFINWPDVKQSDIIAKSLEYQFGFPGVIGVIGCIHFYVSKPIANYVEANSDIYTVQIVCDHNLVLRDVSSLFPGSVSPADVIVKTPIYQRLISKEKPLIEPHKHILGCSAYPQLPTLVTPYPGINLTKDENTFNTLHSNTYNLLNQCFNLIKQRFQRLNDLNLKSPGNIITACCILHNFCLNNGDFHL